MIGLMEGLEADPLIDWGKTSPGTLLIKDVNWKSTRTLGSYVIPVEDAKVAIAAMKNMRVASCWWPSKYHTEDPNCVSYALWLWVIARPFGNKLKRQIDGMVRDVSPRPVRPSQEQGPITTLLHVGYSTAICFLLSIQECIRWEMQMQAMKITSALTKDCDINSVVQVNSMIYERECRCGPFGERGS